MSTELKPSRNLQRLGGFLIVSVCLLMIIATWYFAITERYFYPKLALIFPAFLFIGLGLILFPTYRNERIARGEDISNLSGLQLLTVRWWIILILGLVSGFINFALLKWF